ncbi:hypothetical protein NSZ01_40110 [Nocardioides szechwanensis]|nr:hypothetical protein NSZ01_40110 [Nocardioides szechwanensis]
MRGAPEEADRPAETPGQVQPRGGLLAQGDQQRVFEGHAPIVACLCNELQSSEMIGRGKGHAVVHQMHEHHHTA